MKNRLVIFYFFMTIIFSVDYGFSCSSFAVYGKNKIYGMNFDYSRFPLKFIILETNNQKTFHLAFQRTINGEKVWALTAGMNSNGLFSSCQEEYPKPKNITPPPNENPTYIHHLYLKINDLKNAHQVEKLAGKIRLIQYPGVTVHNLFADKTGTAFITEASESGNKIIKPESNFIVMTNFPNRNLRGKNYYDAKGVGAKRYITAHEYLSKNIDLDLNSAMLLLEKIKNKHPDYPTHCSMVFFPEKNEIYAAINQNYKKIFKIDLNKKTLETFKGFKNQKTFKLDSSGVNFTKLENL